MTVSKHAGDTRLVIIMSFPIQPADGLQIKNFDEDNTAWGREARFGSTPLNDCSPLRWRPSGGEIPIAAAYSSHVSYVEGAKLYSIGKDCCKRRKNLAVPNFRHKASIFGKWLNKYGPRANFESLAGSNDVSHHTNVSVGSEHSEYGPGDDLHDKVSAPVLLLLPLLPKPKSSR